MRFGLVLGNSSFRVGPLPPGRPGDPPPERFSWPDDAVPPDVARAIARLATGGVQGAVAASVRPERLAALRGIWPAGAPPLAVAGEDVPVPIANRYARPGEVGVDRLLACVGARARFPGQSVVVLDLGTALSASCVDPDGAFVGGCIAAGVRAVVGGLHRAAPRLPSVEPAPLDGCLQRSTRDALRAGLFRQLAAGVQGVLDALRCELPPPVRAVVTGGDAPFLAPALDGLDAVTPHLVLEGLAIATEEGGPA